MLLHCGISTPPMSARGQNPNPPSLRLCQLSPAADISWHSSGLLDHLGSEREQVIRYCQADRLGGDQIDDEIEFGRLLNWDVAWLGAAQNLVDKLGGAPKQVREIWPIGNQAASFKKLLLVVHRR